MRALVPIQNITADPDLTLQRGRQYSRLVEDERPQQKYFDNISGYTLRRQTSLPTAFSHDKRIRAAPQPLPFERRYHSSDKESHQTHCESDAAPSEKVPQGHLPPELIPHQTSRVSRREVDWLKAERTHPFH